MLLALRCRLLHQYASFLWVSGAAVLVFRTEVAILLGLYLLTDLAMQRLSLWDCISTCIPAGVALIGVCGGGVCVCAGDVWVCLCEWCVCACVCAGDVFACGVYAGGVCVCVCGWCVGAGVGAGDVFACGLYADGMCVCVRVVWVGGQVVCVCVCVVLCVVWCGGVYVCVQAMFGCVCVWCVCVWVGVCVWCVCVCMCVYVHVCVCVCVCVCVVGGLLIMTAAYIPCLCRSDRGSRLLLLATLAVARRGGLLVQCCTKQELTMGSIL